MKEVLCAALVAGALGLAGCKNEGSSRASVSGKVLVDGQPFNGRIDFIPAQGQGPTSGAAIKDGKYTIDKSMGVAVGDNRVEIRGRRLTGRKIPNPMRAGVLMGESEEAVPPQYNETSTLVRYIIPSHNDLDFDLPGTKPKGK